MAADTVTPKAEPLVQRNWRRNGRQRPNIRINFVVSS